LSFWVKLFEDAGYTMDDSLRPLWWDDSRVFWWYRQNSVLFFRGTPHYKLLPRKGRMVDVVHPELFEYYASGKAHDRLSAFLYNTKLFFRRLFRIETHV
jgi:hypothetical protein